MWLARLSVDRWRLAFPPEERPAAEAAPTALILETAHGPRIVAANAAGIAAGARSGMLLADARALCPELAAVPADPAGDLALLEKLGVWAQRWGPWSALDPPDGVVVDVTGAAHLFGGEEALLADVAAAFAARGLAARAALAPTAGAAWALAHYGPPGAILAPGDDPLRQLGDLPVAALRLDEDVLTVLRRLGIKRLGELAGVSGAGDDPAQEAAARDALRRRFRNRSSPAANPLLRLDQLLGRVPEPLLPVIAQTMPMVQRRLMEPLRHRAPLDRVVEDLAADMVRALEARGRARGGSSWRCGGSMERC